MTTQPSWHIPEWTMGDRLRKAREDAGLSQAELADRIGISRNTVGNAEIGDRTPLLVTLRAWADVTSVPVEWLQTGRTTPAPPPAARRPRRGHSGRSRTDTELMQKRYHGHRHNPTPPLKVAA